MEPGPQEWQRRQKREEAGYRQRIKLLEKIQPLVFLRADRDSQKRLLESVITKSTPENMRLMKDFGLFSRQGAVISDSNMELFQKMTNFPQLLILALTIPSKYFGMPLFQRALRADMRDKDSLSIIKNEGFYACYRDLQRFIYIDAINNEYNLLCEDLSRAELMNNKKGKNQIMVNLLCPITRYLIKKDTSSTYRNDLLQKLTFLSSVQKTAKNVAKWIFGVEDNKDVSYAIRTDPTIDDITGTTSLGKTVKRIMFKIRIARHILNTFELVDLP